MPRVQVLGFVRGFAGSTHGPTVGGSVGFRVLEGTQYQHPPVSEMEGSSALRGSIGDLLAVGCWSKYPLLRFSLSQKVPKADPPTQERRSLGAFGLLSALVPSSRQCGIDSGETARLFSRWWKCSSSITTGQSITIWRSITTSPGAKYPLWKCKSVQRPVAHWARPPASAPGGRSAPRHLRNAKLAQEGRDRWRLEVEHLPSAFLSPVLGP